LDSSLSLGAWAFWGLLKLKIGLAAFKIHALIMGLKICKNL
jgi:hypothetical protein